MKGSLCGVQRDLIKIACSFFHTTIEVILHVPGRIEKTEREAVAPNRRLLVKNLHTIKECQLRPFLKRIERGAVAPNR